LEIRPLFGTDFDCEPASLRQFTSNKVRDCISVFNRPCEEHIDSMLSLSARQYLGYRSCDAVLASRTQDWILPEWYPYICGRQDRPETIRKPAILVTNHQPIGGIARLGILHSDEDNVHALSNATLLKFFPGRRFSNALGAPGSSEDDDN
jgi:hypothetical protein